MTHCQKDFAQFPSHKRMPLIRPTSGQLLSNLYLSPSANLIFYVAQSGKLSWVYLFSAVTRAPILLTQWDATFSAVTRVFSFSTLRDGYSFCFNQSIFTSYPVECIFFHLYQRNFTFLESYIFLFVEKISLQFLKRDKTIRHT